MGSRIIKTHLLTTRDLFTIASETNLPKTKVSIYIIWSNGQIWSFGSVIWLRMFVGLVFIYSVVRFRSNGPTSPCLLSNQKMDDQKASWYSNQVKKSPSVKSSTTKKTQLSCSSNQVLLPPTNLIQPWSQQIIINLNFWSAVQRLCFVSNAFLIF